MAALIADGCILFPSNPFGRPREKKFRSDIASDSIAFPTIIDDIHTSDGTKEIRAIFGETVFDFAKPANFISNLVAQVVDDGSLVLDFFAGSGSTAAAVINLTQTCAGSHCRFIAVQIPELTDKNSAAFRLGYPTISAITIERVKRVIQGYGDDPQPIPDAGFRVFRLAKSRFPRCEFQPDPEKSDAENIEALKAYMAEKESVFRFDHGDERALYDEVLLKNGFQLHYRLEPRADFPDNTVHLVTDGRRSGLVCLDWNRTIADSTIKRLRELEGAGEQPFFLCLEKSLTTTSKWNLNQLLGKRLTAF